MTLLRLARHLFDVVTYTPARPTKPMASATFIGGPTHWSKDELITYLAPAR